MTTGVDQLTPRGTHLSYDVEKNALLDALDLFEKIDELEGQQPVQVYLEPRLQVQLGSDVDQDEIHRIAQHLEDECSKSSWLPRTEVLMQDPNSETHLFDELLSLVDKPKYKCSYCSHTTSRKRDMCTHERTHTKQQPFKCRFCNAKFATSSSRCRHERRHSNPASKFYREECSAELKPDVSDNDNHDPAGSPKCFDCPTCSYKARRKSDFRKHLRTHTAVRPYRCSQCHKSFGDPSARMRHERLHKHPDSRLYLP